MPGGQNKKAALLQKTVKGLQKLIFGLYMMLFPLHIFCVVDFFLFREKFLVVCHYLSLYEHGEKILLLYNEITK